MRKAEIEMHSDGYREARPAVNVKVYDGLRSVPLPLALGQSAAPVYDEEGQITGAGPMVTHYTDPGFTFEWIERQGEDEVNGWWQLACEEGWDMLQSAAEDVFGAGVKVWAEGRSGGWAVVDGLPDVESWDAVAVNRWGRFARMARAYADDVPRSTLWMMHANVYEPFVEAREEAASALDVPDWRTATAGARELAALADEDDDDDDFGFDAEDEAQDPTGEAHAQALREMDR